MKSIKINIATALLLILSNARGQAQVNTTDIAIVSTSSSGYLRENSVAINPVDPSKFVISSNSTKAPFQSYQGPVFQGANAVMSENWGSTLHTSASNDYLEGVDSEYNNGDPATAINRNGRIFINYIEAIYSHTNPNLGPIYNLGGQKISLSDNNGSTWETYTVCPKPANGFLDKNHLCVDNSPSSPYMNNLYCGWKIAPDLGTPTNLGEIQVYKSTNNGVTWTPTGSNGIISSGITGESDNHGINIQTGPNGEIYASWTIYDIKTNPYTNVYEKYEAAIGFNCSFDGGTTWQTAKRVNINMNGLRHYYYDNSDGIWIETGNFLGGGKNMKVNSFTSMAVNQQNGEIYIVWTNKGNPNTMQGTEIDIYVTRSSDNGQNWSQASKVNQYDWTIPDGKDQWFPWIACDEVNGSLAVIYYDSRDYINNDKGNIYVSLSYNGGYAWTDYQINDGNSSFSSNNSNSLYNTTLYSISNKLGDYIGIDLSRGRAVPAWTDDRSGMLFGYTQPFLMPCPANLALCNGVVKGTSSISGESHYAVNNTLTVAGSNCTYSITSTGQTTMKAGYHILLQPGFSADNGSLFEATIENTCNSFGEKLISDGNNAAANFTNLNLLSINIYPNPSQGHFTVSINSAHLPSTITIYDVLGNIVFEKQQIEEKQLDINLTSQPKGLYFVKVLSGDKMEIQKIIIQ